MPLPYLPCMVQAAQYYQLPPRVLPSIQAVEGGFVGAIHPNRDGSDDLGVMQINTRWVQPLVAYIKWKTRESVSPETVHDRLVNDACFNINAAAAILQAQWQQAGRNWVAAVGNYHSRTPALHDAYVAMVMGRARALFGP